MKTVTAAVAVKIDLHEPVGGRPLAAGEEMDWGEADEEACASRSEKQELLAKLTAERLPPQNHGTLTSPVAAADWEQQSVQRRLPGKREHRQLVFRPN